jgi:hypothetical protein
MLKLGAKVTAILRLLLLLAAIENKSKFASGLFTGRPRV